MPAVRIGIYVYEDPDRLKATLDSVRRHTPKGVAVWLLPDGPDAPTRAALAALVDIPQFGTDDPRGTAAVFNRLAAPPGADVVVLLESGCVVSRGWLEPLLAALQQPATGLAGPTTNVSWNEQGAYSRAGGSESEIASAARFVAYRFGDVARPLAPLYSLADFCYAVRRDVIDAIGGADEEYGLGPCWEMDFNIRAARAGFRGVWACGSYVHRSAIPARRRAEEAQRFEASRHRYQNKFCGARLQGRKADFRDHCRGDDCPNFAPASLITIHEPPGNTSNAASSPAVVPAAQTRPPACDVAAPLVSCIMPTSDRRHFVPRAIACFLAQDYPHLELIIVDDGNEGIADVLPSDPRITYIRLRQRMSVGAKRNLACERARGDVIVHWDDDDWYPAGRVRLQVRALLDRNADVCGSSTLYYYDASRDHAFSYRYRRGCQWVAGNTLAYRREAWRKRPFADVQVGEDTRFVWAAGDRLVDMCDPGLCVASIHTSNVSRKDTAGMYWAPESLDVIHRLMASGGPGRCVAPMPLVSCIMPTYNRRAFIRLALSCFRAQTYPNRELIVIDDGGDAIGDLLRDVPTVRYVRLDQRLSIGAKRNRACAEARGEIVAHWDDDDWYAPDRLERQVRPVLRNEADITGLENRFVLEMPQRRFWTVDARLHRAMFVGDVHGGTLVFRRSIWADGVHYPEIDLAEDAVLLRHAMSRGHRLLKLENCGSFVYIRHSRNAWRFDAGSFLIPSGWCRSDPPSGFTQASLDEYASAASMLSASMRVAAARDERETIGRQV